MEKEDVKAGAIACLEKAREILGPNGENWAQGFFAFDKDGKGIGSGRDEAAVKFCAIGALQRADCPAPIRRLAFGTLNDIALKRSATPLAGYNDRAPSFQPIDVLFEEAIRYLKEPTNA